MTQSLKLKTLLIVAFTVVMLSLSIPSQVSAWVGTTVPVDAVQMWGDTQWDDMTLWLNGGTSLADTPIDGISAIYGDFPALVFNSTEFTGDTDYSIYQFAGSGGVPNMWFSVGYSFENLTVDNYFSAFLLSGKQGDIQYSMTSIGNTWMVSRNGSSLNMTGIVPDASGIIDTFMHFDDTDGFITTYLDGVMIDNSTSLDTSDGIGGVGFQVDSNNHEDDLVVALSRMGAFVPLEDMPVPTPTPHVGGGGGGGFSDSFASSTPNPYGQWANPTSTPEPTASTETNPFLLLPVIAIVLVVIVGLNYKRTH